VKKTPGFKRVEFQVLACLIAAFWVQPYGGNETAVLRCISQLTVAAFLCRCRGTCGHKHAAAVGAQTPECCSCSAPCPTHPGACSLFYEVPLALTHALSVSRSHMDARAEPCDGSRPPALLQPVACGGPGWWVRDPWGWAGPSAHP